MLGEYNKNSKEDDEQGLALPTMYEIKESINHPEYKEPSVYNDISLYRLDRDVVFNEFIRPICLHTDYAVSKPYAIATGWGRMETSEYTGKQTPGSEAEEIMYISKLITRVRR